jgi:hypothetical protein
VLVEAIDFLQYSVYDAFMIKKKFLLLKPRDKMNITIIFMMMAAVGAALISAVENARQKDSGLIVGKGCVGECGKTAAIEYKVKATINKMMIARTVTSSLCPNTGAYAFLFKNGVEVTNGSITKDGASIQTESAPGDTIVVYVMTYPLFNKINCIRLGELNFVLIEHDLVLQKEKK